MLKSIELSNEQKRVTEAARPLGPAEHVMWHIGESGCNQVALAISGHGALSTEWLEHSLQRIAREHPIISCRLDLSTHPPTLVRDRRAGMRVEEFSYKDP